jgi:hypothetical protein
LPPDGAREVPLDVPLFGLYDPRAEYLDEDITLDGPNAEEWVLGGQYESAEGLLRLDLPEELEAETRYAVEWPGLRGLGTATVGRGLSVDFRTGAGRDERAPEFDGVTAVDWWLERQRDECTDSQTERFVFDLSLSQAHDDGGEESLALVVFQTVGAESGEAEPVSVTRYGGDDHVILRRALKDGGGTVCFAALVRDLAGRISDSGSVEHCVETQQPPFFEGCRLGAGRSRGAAYVFWGFGALVFAFFVRRVGARRSHTTRRRTQGSRE